MGNDRGGRVWAAMLVVLSALVAVVAWLLGPRPLQLGELTTGDVELAARVRALVADPSGYRGLSVAVIDRGAIRVAGLGDGGGGSPIDEDTAFEIGSVTKVLTGMLLADLIADGKVRADEPLHELLPDVAFEDPELAATPLEELASHRSGLGRLHFKSGTELFGGMFRALRGDNPYVGQDQEWLLSSLESARVGAGQPSFAYSNYGMAVLGTALARRAGMSYADLVEQRILGPLGLRSTRMDVTEAELPAKRASGASASGRPQATWHSSAYAPAGGGAWSTSADLAQLLAAVLRGTAPGLDATTPRFPASGESRIGYGWITELEDGREVTWHNGGTGGFRAYVGFDRANERGSVVLGNTERSVDEIGSALLRTPGGATAAVSARADAGNALTWIAEHLPALLLSLAGGFSLWMAVRRARYDRYQLAAGAAWAIAMPALAYWPSAGLSLSRAIWAGGVALSASALAATVRLWSSAPACSARRAWARRLSAVVSIAAALGALLWLYA